MGQNRQALQSLDRLQLQSPQSTWKPDAQALRLQLLQDRVLRDGGDRVVMLDQPKLQPNDDLKLLAINGLMQSDPQQAIPMLTQVIEGNSSPAVKNRALFVLAQSGTTPGLNELVRVAQTTKDPALAANAVRYIGFYNAKGTDALIQIARSGSAPEVRNQAIRSLGVNGSPAAVAALPDLYPGATDRELSHVVIRTLFQHDQAAALVGLARREKDPELKRELVADLAMMHSKAATDYLLELLKN
ncbi:MAG: HEAT repeat domain-containing protein [Terriglobales bacterium]